MNCAATALAASIAATALARTEQITIYDNSNGSDVVFRLSRDGTAVLRSYFPTPKSPLQNDLWKESTGVVTLPNPSGGAWIASTLNGDGSVVAGRTNSGTALSQAVLYDATIGGLVPGSGIYASCAVAPNPPSAPGSGIPRFRAFLGKPLTGVDVYRPGVGFAPYATPYSAAMPIVEAASFTGDMCGGITIMNEGGVFRTRPFRSASVSGYPVQPIAIPFPDTDGRVELFANDGSALLLTTWRTLPDGTQRHRFVRWQNEADYQIIEIPGGAANLICRGADDALQTIVFNATTPAGTTNPDSIWSAEDGFITGNEYLAARGVTITSPIGALGISGDGTALLVETIDYDIVLFRDLAEMQCGGTASCFVAHSTPGCANGTCCQTVCMIDPFCCTNLWDAFCAQEAQQLCAGCGVPASGSCEQTHANPGCNDAACCQPVCVRDPYCCETQWDTLCVEGALVSCRSGATCAEARLWSTYFTDAVYLDTHGVAPDGVETVCGSNDTVAEWRILRPWCTGVTKISLCDAGSLPQQASISVFDACGGTEIACSDTAGNPGTCPGANSVSLNVYTVVGREYLVRFSMNNGATFASGALQLECVEVCGTGGSCTVEHDTAGCSDGACCGTVCNIDPYCCTTRWDAVCVEEANLYCFDPADIDRDGTVSASDLALLLSSWGLPGPTDINGDGTTDAADLAALLANWG